MRIYLAHPISGLSFEEVNSYYSQIIPKLIAAGYDCLYPMIGKNYLRTEKNFKAKDYQNPISTNHAIVERDSWMVSTCDLVLIDFTGAKFTSIGCVMELAWAYWLRKHTIIVVGEKENPHQHAFILEATDIIFETLKEALDYLMKFSSRSL